MGTLATLLAETAARFGDRRAVEEESGRAWSYADLLAAARGVSGWVAGLGGGAGDRVGLRLPKSLEAVAAIHGILRAGRAYVPVDPTAPAARSAGILADAGVKGVVCDAKLAPELIAAWPEGAPRPPLLLTGPAAGPPDDSRDRLWSELDPAEGARVDPRAVAPDDLAYILYTSGSTGVPKGVRLTHRNALTFLDWCFSVFRLDESDRFSSHAPFHFDLSVFDLYASCRAGGALAIVGETLGKEPARLGAFLRERALTVWYSAPSILAMLSEFGGIDAPDFPAPRLVLFAGEVFPIRKLKRLRAQWPRAEMWNLYGPTETNVCTAHRVPDVALDDFDRPLPIGKACPPLRARVVDESGRDVPPGAPGELVIAGPGVMQGYHNRPDLTAAAFLDPPDLEGGRDGGGLGPEAGDDRWYRTGDIVVEDEAGDYVYHGRRDRMIKKRGYRIELGEIEAALYRHDGVARAGVVARSDEDGVVVVAFVAMRPGVRGSLIAMKGHCARHLPGYMIPDVFVFAEDLPSTSTDKIDYQALKRMAEERVAKP